MRNAPSLARPRHNVNSAVVRGALRICRSPARQPGRAHRAGIHAQNDQRRVAAPGPTEMLSGSTEAAAGCLGGRLPTIQSGAPIATTGAHDIAGFGVGVDGDPHPPDPVGVKGRGELHRPGRSREGEGDTVIDVRHARHRCNQRASPARCGRSTRAPGPAPGLIPTRQRPSPRRRKHGVTWHGAPRAAPIRVTDKLPRGARPSLRPRAGLRSPVWG